VETLGQTGEGATEMLQI